MTQVKGKGFCGGTWQPIVACNQVKSIDAYVMSAILNVEQDEGAYPLE